MGLFGNLFGGKAKETAKIAETTMGACPHAVLVPRWESVQDMGHEEKISRFMCEACQEEFTPEVAAQLRDTINERMDAALEEYREEAAHKAP